MLEMHILYADSSNDTTIVADDNNYLKRWSTTLHIAMSTESIYDSYGFTEVNVKTILLPLCLKLKSKTLL